jgi:hypothetical protein
MPVHSMRAVGWVLAALLFSGCLSPRPPTQVIVFVEAQPLVRTEAAVLEVEVLAGPRGDLAPLADSYVYEARDGALFPRDFTFVPLGGDLSRIFEVQATAYDARRQVITVARLRAGFVEHQARTLRLVLEDRCRGIVCAPGATCRGGRCEQLVDPTRDAGVDLDAGVPEDAPPRSCTTDLDCDDGVFCNGVEACKEQECQPGQLPDCDDRVACTDDTCSGGGCNHVPNAGLCTAAAGGTCDVVNGCQYGTCDSATCVSDGCTSARCEGTTCVRAFACVGMASECCGSACVLPGCDDGLPCTLDYCDRLAPTGAVCVHDTLTGACDDQEACTMGETCVAADGCRGGAPVDCDDRNPCTDDTCDSAVGCLHTNDDTNPYDDGDPCTVGDRCAAGVAMPGAPMACNDGVSCTDDRCEGGTCTYVANDALCTATAGGRCDATNGCQYGTCNMATCVPANSCETATCTSPTTCERRPLCAGQVCCGGVCCLDDANPCTDTACVSGVCGAVNNTAACSDGNACTMGDTCSAGTCGGTAVTCPSLGECRTNMCVSGVCTPGEVTDGTPCDADGSRCTNDVCARGTCVGGAVTPCTDLNPCTDDRCNPSTGACEFPVSPMGSPCPGDVTSPCDTGECNGAGVCTTVGCEAGEICCMGSYCTDVSLCTGGCLPPGTC